MSGVLYFMEPTLECDVPVSQLLRGTYVFRLGESTLCVYASVHAYIICNRNRDDCKFSVCTWPAIYTE